MMRAPAGSRSRSSPPPPGSAPGSSARSSEVKGNPSFRTLYRISQALGVRVGDLLSGSDGKPQQTAHLVRRDQRKRLQLGEHGLQWQLLTPNLQGKLEVLKTAVPPGFTNEEAPFGHEGEECVYLQRGSALLINVAGTTYTLEQGDAITYDSALTHWYSNPTDEEAIVHRAVDTHRVSERSEHTRRKHEGTGNEMAIRAV